MLLATIAKASECPAGQVLNETNGVNINIMQGNDCDGGMEEQELRIVGTFQSSYYEAIGPGRGDSSALVDGIISPQEDWQSG